MEIRLSGYLLSVFVFYFESRLLDSKDKDRERLSLSAWSTPPVTFTRLFFIDLDYLEHETCSGTEAVSLQIIEIPMKKA